MGVLKLQTEARTTQGASWTETVNFTKPYLLNVPTTRLYHIWDSLPEELKNDQELQSHLPCLEHYNRDEDKVHIDGPPPAKYRCRVCKRLHQRDTIRELK